MRCDEDHRGGTGFRGEAVDWVELHHLVSECFDDAPAAHCGAGGHDQGANHFDPQSNALLLRAFAKPMQSLAIVPGHNLALSVKHTEVEPSLMAPASGGLAKPLEAGGFISRQDAALEQCHAEE